MSERTCGTGLPVRVALVVPRHGMREWQIAAITRLEQDGIIGVDAVFDADDPPNPTRERALRLLSMVESLAKRSTRAPRETEPMLRRLRVASEVWPDVRRPAREGNGWIPMRGGWPLILNLSTPARTGRLVDLATIGVLEFWIGRSHDIDDALESCRLGKPTIHLSGVLVSASGRVEVGHAVAGVRERTMVISSMELLLARAVTTLVRSVRAACMPPSDPMIAPSLRPAGATRPFSARHATRLLSAAIGDYARTARERLQSGMPQWFLAYRERPENFISNVLASSPDGLTVITPPRARFYADPCVFAHDGADHVFFEDFSYRAGKGVISWMQYLGPGTFSPPETVLERDYHLAYPFVFRDGADVYMVPETAQARQIELYRAVSFPRRWERVAVLVKNVNAADATLIYENGRWWMFAAVSEDRSSSCDELFVFHANELLGPWQAHTGNPVKSDIRSARPAGRLFQSNGRLIRPAQNCSRRYGGSVTLCEVLELTPSTYRERVIGELHPGWVPGNARFHTVSASERLEFLDGNFSRGCVA
jgi:hypothetical protein